MQRTSSRIPRTHHLASSKPPKSERKDAAHAQRPLLGDPRSATPELWPPCSPPLPPLPATLAAPRRGSPAPRARRAPGPTECSSRPRSSGPRVGPRCAGEVEQEEARGGRAGGDAQGARVGPECVGTHPAAVPTPARDLAETPVRAALRGSCPRLHSTDSKTLATPPGS